MDATSALWVSTHVRLLFSDVIITLPRLHTQCASLPQVITRKCFVSLESAPYRTRVAAFCNLRSLGCVKTMVLSRGIPNEATGYPSGYFLQLVNFSKSIYPKKVTSGSQNLMSKRDKKLAGRNRMQSMAACHVLQGVGRR